MNNRDKKGAFLSGVQAFLPLIPGVVPFGLVVGITATDQGLSPLTTVGMSLLFYAGSAQLVALQLLRDGSLPVIILFTALVINLRFMMYSASVAPHVHSLPWRWKCSLAYMLSDQAYGLSILKFNTAGSGSNAHYFFAGTAISMWLCWNISVMLGIVLGTGIPASWSLDFAIPLAFLAMLVPNIKNSPSLVAAGVGGVIAVLAKGVPYNLGLLLAAVCGILAGLSVELWQQKSSCHSEQMEQ